MPQGHNVPCVCMHMCVCERMVFGSRINLKTAWAEMHPAWNIKTQAPHVSGKISLWKGCVCLCVCLVCKKMHNVSLSVYGSVRQCRQFLEFLHTGSLALMYNSTFQLDRHDSFSTDSTRTLHFTTKNYYYGIHPKTSIIAHLEKDLQAFPFS